MIRNTNCGAPTMQRTRQLIVGMIGAMALLLPGVPAWSACDPAFEACGPAQPQPNAAPAPNRTAQPASPPPASSSGQTPGKYEQHKGPPREGEQPHG
jgi:hypothetical protein